MKVVVVVVVMLGTITLISGSASADGAAFSSPANVIFDTDACIDIDDGMALAIVHALVDRHEARLVAVTVSLDETWCAPYVDVLNTFYGHLGVPVGTIRNGLSLKTAEERISLGMAQVMKLPHVKQEEPQLGQQPSDDTFAQYILKRRNPDGSPVDPHRLTPQNTG
jgi:hypothetical protein